MEHSLLLWMSLDIFDMINTTIICAFEFLWPLRLRWLLVFDLYMEFFFNFEMIVLLIARRLREVGKLGP